MVYLKYFKTEAFTLVELIVVIVILAILATIAFLSFNSYSSSARDSTRMSNISMISKGIDMSIALGRGINTSEAGTGMNIVIVGSGGISYTGYYMNIGNKLLSSIQVSGGDILSDSFQKYQLTYIPDKKYYQVLGLLENQLGSSYIENNFNESENNNINKKKTNISINNLSIIPKVYSSTTSSGYAFIKGNFPTNTASGGYIKGLIPKDYTNAPVVNGISVVSGTGDILLPAEIISSGGGYVTDGGGGTISPSSCAIGSYSGVSTQTYNLPSILDHTLIYTGTTNVGIAYGTGIYTATLNCNDGVVSVINETVTNNCYTNYTWNGSSCLANTQVMTCNGLPASANWNTVSSITQTWNGSSWLPTTIGVYNTTSSTTNCNFKCNSGFNWNGSSCIPTIYTSCNAIKIALPTSTDGIYTIDPDGTGGNTSFSVYCDMTTDGGGWTLVGIQVPTNTFTINSTGDINPSNFGSIIDSWRIGNTKIQSFVPTIAWKLQSRNSSNNNIVDTGYFKPTCVISWTITWNGTTNTMPLDCQIAYTNTSFSSVLGGTYMTSNSSIGIGQNNSGGYCSMRMGDSYGTHNYSAFNCTAQRGIDKILLRYK